MKKTIKTKKSKRKLENFMLLDKTILPLKIIKR